MKPSSLKCLLSKKISQLSHHWVPFQLLGAKIKCLFPQMFHLALTQSSTL